MLCNATGREGDMVGMGFVFFLRFFRSSDFSLELPAARAFYADHFYPGFIKIHADLTHLVMRT